MTRAQCFLEEKHTAPSDRVDLRDAYSNTFDQVTALMDRFLVPVNQTSDDPDPNVHHAWDEAEQHSRTGQPWALKHRLDPDEHAAIVAKFNDGARQTDLADEYGISRSSIKRILRRARWGAGV